MLHIDESGSGSTIGFVHGFTQTLRSWEEVVDRIEGARLVRVDLPGHGLSPLMVPAFPDSASQIVDTIGPGCYVGYSMGGRLCLRAAIDRPDHVRRLILIGATPGIEDTAARSERLERDLQLADRIEAIGLRAFIDEWLAQPMFDDLDHGSEEYRLENTAKGLASALRVLGTGAMEPMWRALKEIRAPTLIIAGERDRKFVEIAHRMQEGIIGSRMAVVEGAGHAAHLESPEEVTTLIQEFVE